MNEQLPEGFQVEFIPGQQESLPEGFQVESIPQPQPWSQVAERAVGNLPASAFQTAQGISELGTVGGLARTGTRIAEDPAGFANNLIKHLARYTTLEGFKEALATDPAGTAVDIMGVAAPAIGGVAKLAEVGRAGELARARAPIEPPPPSPPPGAAPVAPVAPTGLKASGAETLNAVRASPDRYSNLSFQPVLDDLKTSLEGTTYDPRIHNTASIALEEMQKRLGQPPQSIDPMAPMVGTKMPTVKMHTFDDLHKMRIFLRNVRKSANAEERMFGYRMKDALDEYAVTLGETGKQFKQGLREYSQGSKLEEIEDLIDRANLNAQARYTTAGLPHAIALEFKKIALNPKKMRLWTPAEQAKIREIATKGALPQKIASAFGKLAIRGPVTLGTDAIVGYLAHSILPGGPLTLAVAGEVGRQAERVLAMRGVESLKSTVAAGAGDEAALVGVVSPEVYQALQMNPQSRAAVEAFFKATGGAKSAAGRALAIAIAKQLNVPNMIPRIELELKGIGKNQERFQP